jgi:hypothetical protein
MYQYSEAALMELANQAKEQIIFALANEDLLNGDPEVIARDYVIVLYKKGWLGRHWDKFRGIKDDGSYFAVLKNIPLGVASDNDDEEKPKATIRHLKAVPPKKDDEED